MQQVECGASDQAEIGRRVIFACSVGILAELHVEDPMLLIFDGPVIAYCQRYAGDVAQRAPVIAPFATDLPASSRVDSTIATACKPSQSGF